MLQKASCIFLWTICAQNFRFMGTRGCTRRICKSLLKRPQCLTTRTASRRCAWLVSCLVHDAFSICTYFVFLSYLQPTRNSFLSGRRPDVTQVKSGICDEFVADSHALCLFLLFLLRRFPSFFPSFLASFLFFISSVLYFLFFMARCLMTASGWLIFVLLAKTGLPCPSTSRNKGGFLRNEKERQRAGDDRRTTKKRSACEQLMKRE